jgi:hypothetical protein
VTVSGNYLLGGNFPVEAGSTSATYKISNVSIANNYIGFGTFGLYYPTTTGVASVTGNTIVDFTNPTYSMLALAAYQAARLRQAVDGRHKAGHDGWGGNSKNNGLTL